MSQHLNLVHKPPSKPTTSESLNLLPMPSAWQPGWQHKALPPTPKQEQQKPMEHIPLLPTHPPILNQNKMESRPSNHPSYSNQNGIKPQPPTHASPKDHNNKPMLPTHGILNHNKLPTYPPHVNQKGNNEMVPNQKPSSSINKNLPPIHELSEDHNNIKTNHKLPEDQNSIKATHEHPEAPTKPSNLKPMPPINGMSVHHSENKIP